MPKRHLATLAFLLLFACRNAPERVVEPRGDEGPAARGEGMLRQVMLDGHNRARDDVGVASLVWDDGLAAHALGYARTMARTGRFEHAEQPVGPLREGENLWTGTRDAYRYDEMMGHWLAERADYVNGPVPAISRTGDWRATSHYSQIVWRGTLRFGCALASNRTDDFLVCRYSSAGNVVGERAF